MPGQAGGSHESIMLETHRIFSAQEQANVGAIQFHAAAVFHQLTPTTEPVNAAVAAKSSRIGVLASGVEASKVDE